MRASKRVLWLQERRLVRPQRRGWSESGRVPGSVLTPQDAVWVGQQMKPCGEGETKGEGGREKGRLPEQRLHKAEALHERDARVLGEGVVDG